MTVSLMMLESGRRQQVLKCPSDLVPILGREDGYITEADGAQLRQWIAGARQLDPEIERNRNLLQSTTEQGMDALRKAWTATPKYVRDALGQPFLEQLKAAASAFEAIGEPEKPATVQMLNDQVSDESEVDDDPF